MVKGKLVLTLLPVPESLYARHRHELDMSSNNSNNNSDLNTPLIWLSAASDSDLSFNEDCESLESLRGQRITFWLNVVRAVDLPQKQCKAVHIAYQFLRDSQPVYSAPCVDHHTNPVLNYNRCITLPAVDDVLLSYINDCTLEISVYAAVMTQEDAVQSVRNVKGRRRATARNNNREAEGERGREDMIAEGGNGMYAQALMRHDQPPEESDSSSNCSNSNNTQPSSTTISTRGSGLKSILSTNNKQIGVSNSISKQGSRGISNSNSRRSSNNITNNGEQGDGREQKTKINVDTELSRHNKPPNHKQLQQPRQQLRVDTAAVLHLSLVMSIARLVSSESFSEDALLHDPKEMLQRMSQLTAAVRQPKLMQSDMSAIKVAVTATVEQNIEISTQMTSATAAAASQRDDVNQIAALRQQLAEQQLVSERLQQDNETAAQALKELQQSQQEGKFNQSNSKTCSVM